jgi:imidazolonepropionase-like amidohydrolase
MIFRSAVALLLFVFSATAWAETESFVFYRQDTQIGRLVVEVDGRTAKVDFDVKDNGRGPTVTETLTLDADGLPGDWKITGTQTFGGKIDETFRRRGNTSDWKDSGGPGRAKGPAKLYIAQSASPWALQLYARAILKAGGPIDVLPGGTLALTQGERLTLQGAAGELAVTRYDLTGLDLNPTIMLLDDARRLIALPSASGGMVRTGFEGENPRLRKLAADWQSARWAVLQRESAKRFDGPVRIANVRLFDPVAKQLTAPVSVVVNGRTISGVQPADSPATPGETVIDGAGGTLVPGMFEMHGHLGESGALLNLLAGVTGVRDMGNSNSVLDALDRRIIAGEVAGPRIVRSGFVEGKSPFSANNGFVVDSEARAVEAVRWYAARGFTAIKIYNSVDPKWVPALVAEARRLGLRVMGHVPAFTSADAMIAAGYDEITHINQLALGWIIKPGEDTRTLFRLTALGRLSGLDLDSAAVQSTLDTMKDKGIALDPTIGIHENLLLNRDGSVAPGATDYFANMPIGVQRDLKQAWSNPDTFGGDASARVAFDKLMDLLRRAHAKGIFIVTGTDTGGALTFHRELELLVQAGFTPAEALARATLDMARYLGIDQTTGSIARGKVADFFLVPGDPTRDIKAIKTISLVAKDGAFYLPTEVYPRLGIKPFVAAPKITEPLN